MFLSIPFIKGDNCDNEHTKGEKLRPCNHCDHPLAFVWGCQKFTPERGNRLPRHGSAVNRISQYPSIVNAAAGICRYGAQHKAEERRHTVYMASDFSGSTASWGNKEKPSKNVKTASFRDENWRFWQQLIIMIRFHRVSFSSYT